MPPAAYRAFIWLLLFSALAAPVLDVRAGSAASRQTPIQALRVPELDTGFHLLYELRPEKARSQFEALEMSHPENPLVVPRKQQRTCLRSPIARAS